MTTEPTCLEAGYTTYTCTRCEAGTEGHTYTDNEVPALGHKYDVVTTEPTCLEPGYTTYTCTRCEAGTDGHTYQGNDVPALGHKYTIVFDKGDNDPKVDNTYFDQVNWYKQSENHLYKPATMTMAETHIFLCERCSSEDKQKDDNILKVELENTETGEHKILDKDEKTNESYWHFIDGYDPADDTIGKCYNVCLDDDCQDGAKALETNSYKETIPEKYQEKYAELVKANGGKQVVLYDHVVNDQIGWTYVEGTATCYFNGYDEGVCAHCGGKTRQIRKTDDKRPEHQYGDYHVVKDAVDEDHAHMRICTVEGCGHEEYGKHTFTAWEVVEKETLFKDRVEERHCVDCLDEEGNPYTETRVVESSNKIVVFIRWLAGLFAFKGSILYNAAKWLYDVLNPFKPIDG